MLLDIALLALLPNIVFAIGNNQGNIVLENESGVASFSTDNGSIVAHWQLEE